MHVQSIYVAVCMPAEKPPATQFFCAYPRKIDFAGSVCAWECVCFMLICNLTSYMLNVDALELDVNLLSD